MPLLSCDEEYAISVQEINMFQNKTVIITGGAIGIGKATAIEFARQHANVCIVDVDAKGLDIVKRELVEMGANVSAYICDVSDETRVRDVVDAVKKQYGKIDILVNNAGIWRMQKTFWNTESSDWKRSIDINILGTMYFTHAVLPHMMEQKYGRIINIGSVAGIYGNATMVAYSMTKGAISSFTKALAKEVAAFGITVNNVAPGNVKNEGCEDNLTLSFMNRSGKLEEFAYLISFLASDKAAFISGQDYLIDGCRKKM